MGARLIVSPVVSLGRLGELVRFLIASIASLVAMVCCFIVDLTGGSCWYGVFRDMI
jgi:hypothetical protein